MEPFDSITEAVNSVNPILNQIVIGIVILLLGFLIARIVGRLLQKLFQVFKVDEFFTKLGLLNLDKGIANIVSFIIYTISILWALSWFRLIPFFYYVLAIVLALIFIFSLIISIRDFLPNFLGGITLKHKKLLKRGDIIRVNGIKGKVTYVGWIECYLKDKDDERIYIPNSYFFKHVVTKIKKL